MLLRRLDERFTIIFITYDTCHIRQYHNTTHLTFEDLERPQNR